MSWLRDHGFACEDAAVVAAELLANAVVVARNMVRMEARVEPAGLSIEVADDGAGRADLADVGLTMPADESEVGRGLYLVRVLSDDVSILSTPEGTVVRALLAAQVRRTPEQRRSADDPATTGC
jgi:anti-sigma regulatory factor (Ser/Thr protein kinase)